MIVTVFHSWGFGSGLMFGTLHLASSTKQVEAGMRAMDFGWSFEFLEENAGAGTHGRSAGATSCAKQIEDTRQGSRILPCQFGRAV